MRIAIMGFPRSGKTTLFNVLARTHAPTGFAAASSGGLNIGTVEVPDERLVQLRDLYRPKKFTPARVEYVDLAGAQAPGPATADGLYPPRLQAADLIVCVVRAFRNDAVPHPFDSVDPARDIRRFGEEMLLHDLQIVEKRIVRLRKSSRVGAAEADAGELDLLLRCREALEGERPLRELEFSAPDAKRLGSFQFVTARPLLVVLNIGEGDLPAGSPLFADLAATTVRPGTALVQAAAKTEMDLAGLHGPEQLEFMSLLGIAESSLDRLIRVSYDLLGFCSFFTVGADEVRAWTIGRGARAVDAAAVIHSDLARGFIRAEVARWDELLDAGGTGPLRERGRLRLEGRDYRVEDGDVLNIRFSV